MSRSNSTDASIVAFREGAADPWLVSEEMVDEQLLLDSVATLKPTHLAGPEVNQWVEGCDAEGVGDHSPLYHPLPPAFPSVVSTETLGPSSRA